MGIFYDASVPGEMLADDRESSTPQSMSHGYCQAGNYAGVGMQGSVAYDPD